MNRTFQSGNLTRDPELTTSAGGLSICKFGIAVNQPVKKGDTWEDVAHFFDVTYFGRRGELMAEKANKGDRVYVVGRLDYSSWESEDGSKRSKVGIVADDVEGEFVFRTSGATRAKPQAELAADAAPAPGGDDDDIPF